MRKSFEAYYQDNLQEKLKDIYLQVLPKTWMRTKLFGIWKITEKSSKIETNGIGSSDSLWWLTNTRQLTLDLLSNWTLTTNKYHSSSDLKSLYLTNPETLNNSNTKVFCFGFSFGLMEPNGLAITIQIQSHRKNFKRKSETKIREKARESERSCRKFFERIGLGRLN